ncbi:MAG TPA: tetratricopeptide repeat protein [Thermoguttaceae bacterium]|nr:tetratricopeptide repeat protein [Thermoguttaceae bacterium]
MNEEPCVILFGPGTNPQATRAAEESATKARAVLVTSKSTSDLSLPAGRLGPCTLLFTHYVPGSEGSRIAREEANAWPSRLLAKMHTSFDEYGAEEPEFALELSDATAVLITSWRTIASERCLEFVKSLESAFVECGGSMERAEETEPSAVEPDTVDPRGSTDHGEESGIKKCLTCGKDVQGLRHTCPHCGGEAFMASGNDVGSFIDAMGKQAEAKEHVDRGAELAMQGRYGEAEAELKKAIEINPTNATAHGNMGGVFLKSGRPKEAIPWLEKALELNPHLEGVSDALSHAKAQAGQGDANGCFIATACYGSPQCRELVELRRFRDDYLLRSRVGSLLVRLYYRVSPYLADRIRNRPKIKRLVKQFLIAPILKVIRALP